MSLSQPAEAENMAILQAMQHLVEKEKGAQTKGSRHQIAKTFVEKVAIQLLKKKDPHMLPTELWNTYKVCLRKSVEQTLQVAAITKERALSTRVSDLLHHIDNLTVTHKQFEDLRYSDLEMDRILDQMYLERAPQETSLSPFEQRALQKRIVSRIQAANSSEESSVDDLIRQWRDNTVGASLPDWKSLTQTVVDYYLRIQQPFKATKWMQIRENIPSEAAFEDLLEAPSPNSSSQTNETSQFVELEAVNEIFSENENERVKQKLNLLDIWATQVDSPIVPWRATEILESLESEASTIGSKPYVTVLDLWLNKSQLHNSKAMDIAMRCPEFSPQLVKTQAHLLVRQEQSEPGSALKHALVLAKTMERHFDEFPDDDILPLAENIARLIPNTLGLFHFVDMLMNRGVPISSPIVEIVFRSINYDTDPSRVRRFMSLLQKNVNREVFCSGVNWCFDRGDASQARLIVVQAISSLQANNNAEPAVVADFLCAAIKHDKVSIESVWILLDEVEEVLFKPASPKAPSPIPYQFYQSLVVRFDLEKHLAQFELLMNRLDRHQRRGFSDLHPRVDICRRFCHCLNETRGLTSLDDRIRLLNKLLARCESSATNEETAMYKPPYIMFDWIIGGLKQRAGISSASQGESGHVEADVRQAVSLLEAMYRHGVATNSRRPFLFNATMEMVTRYDNKHIQFKTVVMIKRYLLSLGVQPNEFTVENQLRACERASFSSNRKQAFEGWKMMAVALFEARRLGVANTRTYLACFRAMLANREVESGKEERKNKILACVFESCCADGMLTEFSRHAFLSLAPKEMKERLHHQRLQEGGIVPSRWRRITFAGQDAALKERTADS